MSRMLGKLLALALLSELMSDEERIIPTDDSPKKIGDRVKLIDKHQLNYFIDVETDKQLSTNFDTLSDAVVDLFINEEMVVTEVDIRKIYNCGHCEHEHVHDMVVFISKMNKRYYVNSKCFKVL